MNGSNPPVGEADSAEAVECLYRRFYARLVRHAVWRHRLSQEDALEIVQDAFVLALTRLDERGNPQAWLYRVVDNLAANWRRKINRRDRLREAWAGELGGEPPSFRQAARNKASEE